jgi:hypothetical protein
MEKELMKNIKSLIVIVGFLAMCSCAGVKGVRAL